MNVGQMVLLRGYGGEKLVRKVLSDGDGYLVVCREEEFLAAEREGRQPTGVGFSKKYILEANARTEEA